MTLLWGIKPGKAIYWPSNDSHYPPFCIKLSEDGKIFTLGSLRYRTEDCLVFSFRSPLGSWHDLRRVEPECPVWAWERFCPETTEGEIRKCLTPGRTNDYAAGIVHLSVITKRNIVAVCSRGANGPWYIVDFSGAAPKEIPLEKWVERNVPIRTLCPEEGHAPE